MSILRRLVPMEHRDLTFQQVWGAGLDLDDRFAGRITETKALALTAVYACVGLLSDACGSLPLDTFRKTGEVRTEIPGPAWTRTPNPEQTPFEFVSRVVTSMTLWGNAYLGKVTDEGGAVVELWPLDPRSVKVDRDEMHRKRFTVNGRRVDPSDIVHVPAFVLPGEVEGLSPIAAARTAVGLSLAAESFGERYFTDGAHPSGVLEAEGILDEESAKTLQTTWQRRHAGRRLPAVLAGGLKWKPVSVTNEDSQFLETRKFQVAEVARLFRVPPHMIGDVERSTSWGTGIEEQGIGFVTYTLRPWLIRMEQAFSGLLPRPQFVRFNVEGLLRGNTTARYGAYHLGRQAGFLSVDEIRAKEDMPPLPDGAGQTYLSPLNMEPTGTQESP